MKGDWKCVALGYYGALYATDSGLKLTPELCAVVLATVMKKVVTPAISFAFFMLHSCMDNWGFLVTVTSGCLQGKAHYFMYKYMFGWLCPVWFWVRSLAMILVLWLMLIIFIVSYQNSPC